MVFSGAFIAISGFGSTACTSLPLELRALGLTGHTTLVLTNDILFPWLHLILNFAEQ